MVHSKKKYVFSRTQKTGNTNAHYVNGNIKVAVEEIKNEDGLDIWLYGGGSLITSFINNDLIDQYVLAIYPVILGAGKPLFQNISHKINLHLDKVESSSNIMLAYYNSTK